MQLFDVYPLLPITIVKAENCRLWAADGTEYLDFYGGHAVISIGHSHPDYVQKIASQLEQIGFYSNSVANPLQAELAMKLGRQSGYSDYNLFLCNSGAEANENALKSASFATGKKRFIAFRNAFHGRTSAAVAATDNAKIIAPVNETDNFIFCEFDDVAQFEACFESHKTELAGVIIEGIQGIGGINIPSVELLQAIAQRCSENHCFFICDEVQSGYGRSGKFFAHQYADVRPDIITVAKGMGNGFPIGAALISPKIEARPHMLGTTFGGNHLACAAAIAVLDVLDKEALCQAAAEKGDYLMASLRHLSGISQLRGRGLMVAVDFPFPAASVAKRLRDDAHILVGSASNPNTMRLLPPLSVSYSEIDRFVDALNDALKTIVG